MATISTLSRRASEFTGVALFAGALIWLIALVSHEPSDPVWFFTAGDGQAAANFVGLVGAFLSEASLQVFGYASFVIPVLLGVAGWNFFWCRQLDAAYTKIIGAGLLFLGVSAAGMAGLHKIAPNQADVALYLGLGLTLTVVGLRAPR